MARKTRGRVARPQEAAENDPVINLVIAAIKRAKVDLVMPTRQPGGRNELPSAAEKESAREFLAELYQSATRRTP